MILSAILILMGQYLYSMEVRNLKMLWEEKLLPQSLWISP